MIGKTISISSILLLLYFWSNAQTTYSLDASKVTKEIKSGHLKMGNAGPAGKEIQLNNWYVALGGKPMVPVMGEMHFFRYPKEQWEDAMLKMKANGITIIATYLPWIQHEEIEGQFDWSGNKDFRYFLKLCQKHSLWAYPRIGPWCHAEVRNGGTPDWILQKKHLADRSNDPVYQSYVNRWYGQIARQLAGLLYKDGGPVIGVQLENEYGRGQAGEAHIRWLKQTAIRHGIDVPMYTVTGWDNASVPQDEVVPLFGGYPEAPWNPDLERVKSNVSFEFELRRDDATIGNEHLKKEGAYVIDHSRYPYFTCELGVGNQLSEHRRPIISPMDGLTIATAKIGSGSNLPGYYVFTGGLNPVGMLTTMEENRDETGYWNEYPDISYDFQAAIRETGELAPAYHQIKKLHYFLREFGSALAPTIPVLAPVKNAPAEFQYAVRLKDDAGFLFGLNYYRGVKKTERKNAQFHLRLKNENLVFPSHPVHIPDSSVFIWPFNFGMDGTTLKYATAQPLCRIDQPERTDWFFIQQRGIVPELGFDAATIERIESTSGKVTKSNNQWIVSDMKPGLDGMIDIRNKAGKQQRIIILSDEQSNRVWLFENQGRKHLFISDANLYLDQKKLRVYGPSNEMKLIALSDASMLQVNDQALKGQPVGMYTEYRLSVPKKTITIEAKPQPVMADASWLKVSVKELTPQNQLFRKLFVKEFSLGNPAAIKSAKMILATEVPGKIRINQTWVNQEISVGKTSQLDLTGYLQKGENLLLMDFPFVAGEAAFEARIEVEYANSDAIEFTTDSSWLTLEQYTIPAPFSTIKDLKAPEVVKERKLVSSSSASVRTDYTLTIPNHALDGLNNLYLHLNYTGDKGRCRLNYRLITDNFNNGMPWSIELKRFGDQLEGQSLSVELYPLKPGYQILFDREPDRNDVGKAEINYIQAIPEYKIDLMLGTNELGK